MRIAGDLPATRPHYEKVGDKIQNAAISRPARAPCSKPAVKFYRPGEKGDIRDLTRTPAVAERDPACRPTGIDRLFCGRVWRVRATYCRSIGLQDREEN